MTAKRFTLAYADYDWWAICDKENPTERGISGEDIVELLNELNDENEQLKYALNQRTEQYDKYYQENEQLKKDIEYYKTERLALFEYLDKKDDLKLELKVEK